MKKLLLLIVIFLITGAVGFAQIKSPEEFLGYKIGTRFTPHHKIVSYFEYVAEHDPNMVRLQQYGETNEQRPLYLTFISSQENMSHLEDIRMNNLRLAHIAKDKRMPTEEAPAIVWLSYNVHGNEAASSEAAMLTLFALVDPAHTQSKAWLKNTVVVIDPCLNPDGRARYVNWYNGIVGRQYNPLRISREHREPWPGGRSNHYNFDLNRDWVWQTQVESQQRMAQYNKWLPQVHVDFHEQGVNSPYYFPPAAEPYHEVITPWQREFQKMIGKNNAKYFDKNNWLYFTGEKFDLLYPSYGDTYPLYNGAIGMTYEQAGISAGLGIITEEEDTLTLVDRTLHHYTSGLSTIELASENASKLVKEFHDYFNDAVNGKVGEYKTYVIKNKPEDVERISSLMKLLDKNGIRYGTGSGNAKGYDYQNKQEVAVTITKGDLVISATQPKAVMVKVLFEPQSKLADSVTYDITAWSLPYVYGLEAYAIQQSIPAVPGVIIPEFVKNNPEEAYGYVIQWQGITSAKAVAQLLKKGIKMRFAENPFSENGESFDRGSVIITGKGNKKFGNELWKTVGEICDQNQIKMNPVSTGLVTKGNDFGSDNDHSMEAPKVVMLTGEGVNAYAAGEIWNFFDKEIDYKLSLINATDFNRIKWDDMDVLILPDGNYRFLNDTASAKNFKQWIEKGGRVIALERAVQQLSKQKWSTLHAKNDSASKDTAKQKDPYAALKIFANRERDDVSKNIPGAIFKVAVDNTHPLMFGYPKYYYTLKMDNRVYNFIKDDGWNVGVIKKESPMAGFVGYQLKPKLKDALLFGVQDLGRGTVTYLADDVMFRNFWENGKLILCNAVFLVGQ